MSTKPKLEHRALTDLVDYLLQAAFSGTTTKQDDQDLRESIERDELRQPIEILPENNAGIATNSILDGHRRKNALLALGKKSVPVLVRYDLTDTDRATIDRIFLDANSVRRQLDPIAKAYIAAKQMEIEHRRPFVELLEGGWEADELRDRVGKMLDLSGRHLSRLLNVIRTPLEVQAAVRQKKLSIVLAEKVKALSQTQQDEIAKQIRAGGVAKEIIQAVVGLGTEKHGSAETALRRYMKALATSVEHLSDDLKEIKFGPKPEQLAVLQCASKLNTRLIDRLRKNEQRNGVMRDQSIKQLKKLIGGRTKRQD